MRLYLIKRKDRVGYDEYDSFIVRAGTPRMARKMAALRASDEGERVWLNPEDSTVIRIKDEGPAGIVLGSYNAG